MLENVIKGYPRYFHNENLTVDSEIKKNENDINIIVNRKLILTSRYELCCRLQNWIKHIANMPNRFHIFLHHPYRSEIWILFWRFFSSTYFAKRNFCKKNCVARLHISLGVYTYYFFLAKSKQQHTNIKHEETYVKRRKEPQVRTWL